MRVVSPVPPHGKVQNTSLRYPLLPFHSQALVHAGRPDGVWVSPGPALNEFCCLTVTLIVYLGSCLSQSDLVAERRAVGPGPSFSVAAAEYANPPGSSLLRKAAFSQTQRLRGQPRCV